MLPRRDPKNVAPNYVPPQPTGGSVGGRRPLNLVTNRQPFRASTVQMAGTESPVSETSSQENPPMPSQLVTLPHLPTGGGGLRRRSTRRTTYETYSSASEERNPPQPPNNAPMHPPRPDPGPAHYEPAGISEGIHAGVWPTYNKVSQEFDEKRLKQWNDDLDVLLIFAALFSAIVTAFLIRALDDLEPNYQRQSALLLHQLLNGRDPKLADMSDPTIPDKPTNSAIVVNCLWFASLLASLGASLCAIVCKGWLTEYNGGANPVVGLLRACRRHIRFMALQRLNVHTLVAFLPALLHSSVLLFFAGVIVYLRRMDERVAIVFVIMGGIFGIAYFLLTILPFMTNPPFRPYSTFSFYRLSVVIGKIVIPIVDTLTHICYLTLRHVIDAILFPLTIFSTRTLRRWHAQARMILPGEYKHMHVWWADALNDPLDEIDTSQKVQEEAILWLSQVPLDPFESKALVSSLALISSSRPYSFQKPVIIFLNLVLEASLREEDNQGRTDVAIDCVLVLGHMKFQSAVDRDWDRDHNVGGIPITASVAWAVQQLTINAFREKSNTPHSEGIRARLLTASAWLSPMDSIEDVHLDSGEVLKIQDRYQFTQEIRNTLLSHASGENVLDGKVLVNLIHGMHACIPRGDYGSVSSIISFLPSFCKDYESAWSEDEAVLRALITYALDLLLPPERRKPLVEREVAFDELTSELIDTLAINTVDVGVVMFGFWLIYRVPYAFRSRKTTLSDIARIWTSTNKVVPENYREQLNLYAVDAFVAIAQSYVAANGTLSKLTPHTALRLLNTALEYHSSRAMATYAVAMILNLGTSTQVATFASGIRAEPFIEALLDLRCDLERSTMEDIVDLRIYSALILHKFRPVELDVEKVKVLVGEMEKTIGDTVTMTLETEISPDLDRVRWKSIYLSALLLAFVPEDEREERIRGLRARVQTLLRSRGLPLVGDYERYLKPLGMVVVESRTTEQREMVSLVFGGWIGEFPLSPLIGSVTSVKT